LLLFAVSGPEMAEALTPDVLKILVSLRWLHLHVQCWPHPRQLGNSSSVASTVTVHVLPWCKDHAAHHNVLTCVTAWVLLLQTSGTMRPVVRKKASLCLLRLMRKTPADSQMVAADSFAPIMAQLLEERDLGMLLCCVTLLLGICARCGSGKLQPPPVVHGFGKTCSLLCWHACWPSLSAHLVAYALGMSTVCLTVHALPA
jgi:hypothetical protein